LEMARMMTEKVHARYKKRDRGTAAMSEAGEVATTLLQFPKAVLGRFADSALDVITGHTHQQKWSGAQVLIGNFIMMAVANEMYQQVWGRATYYDPILKKEVEYKPYSLGSMIGALNPGSFQATGVLKVVEINKLTAELISGAVKGDMSEKERDNKVRQILKNVDTLGESYIPFMSGTLGILESHLDKKSYKLLSTSFDEITERTSATSKNEIERSWVNKIRHALGGGNVSEENEGTTIIEKLFE